MVTAVGVCNLLSSSTFIFILFFLHLHDSSWNDFSYKFIYLLLLFSFKKIHSLNFTNFGNSQSCYYSFIVYPIPIIVILDPSDLLLCKMWIIINRLGQLSLSPPSSFLTLKRIWKVNFKDNLTFKWAFLDALRIRNLLF